MAVGALWALQMVGTHVQMSHYRSVLGGITREGGKVIRFTNQGKRKTAFPIAKNPKALYMHCLYIGNPGLVAEFERNLKMIDSVSKFQSIKIGDDVEHPSFGEGVIVEVRGQGDKAEATIRFRDAGTKHLSLAWAPLKRI